MINKGGIMENRSNFEIFSINSILFSVKIFSILNLNIFFEKLILFPMSGLTPTLTGFDHLALCDHYEWNWILRSKFFSRRGIFFSIPIIGIKMKLKIITKKYWVNSALQFPTKSIIQPMVFKQTVRHRGS